MILLGYDIMMQETVVRYKDQKLILKECDRAREIINGLVAVSKKVSSRPMWSSQQGDLEINVLIRTPYTRYVEYSEKAWSALLSVAQ
ncbi:hypothetical protein LCGC14_2751120 [marine sediment metagenome]|uniref:Uncharacterized protein n=1 Tax=marine sediment metagenome TaxID=412755 RepID=A0A0F8ZNS3_9ZZZZ